MILHYNFEEKDNFKMLLLLSILLIATLLFVISFQTRSILDELLIGVLYVLIIPTVFVKYLHLNFLYKNFNGHPIIKLEDGFLNLLLVENRSLNMYKLPLSTISTIKFKKNYIEIYDRFSSKYRINNSYLTKEDYILLCNFLQENFFKEEKSN